MAAIAAAPSAASRTPLEPDIAKVAPDVKLAPICRTLTAAATYSIKAVAEATGLTVETLRAWERRYGVIEPKRGAGGHRFYTTHDVSRLRRLHETTARGHAISKIAHLSNDALNRLLSDQPPRASTCRRASRSWSAFSPR